ncbi:hypothetical protein BSU04_13770 [Caballeronia sordidicola]|uniref:Uncharacterized protein n=1 Tax=Caballeronia sordidicola TaxID=196367 RepID=A0A226X3M3_CABSO|nr:hypothetical protein BSU04_13770 [Caballeronia sordidicola]
MFRETIASWTFKVSSSFPLRTVLDHGDPHAVLFAQNVITQNGFFGTEKTGQDCDGDAMSVIIFSLSVSHERKCGAQVALPRRTPM